MPKDYYNHKSFCYGSVFVWQKNNVYVMDNHLSAAWCWMQRCEVGRKYNFIHIDKHYDMLDCFNEADIALLKNCPRLSYEEFKNMKCSDRDIGVFRWDNYIMAIYCLFPEWFHTNIFLTHNDGDIYSALGRMPFKLREENPLYMDSVIDQYLGCSNKYLDGLTEETYDLPWIVNLDLDVFYATSEPHVQLFSNDYIRKIANLLNRNMPRIQVITIALSPDCNGGDNIKTRWKNAFHILNVLSEEIDSLKDFPFPE